ncbi:MAG: EAL domain-containing protein, partial [Burkholderiaceae bacterium]
QIGTVYREGRAIVSNNLALRDNMELWRERFLRHGFHSCASFPILRGGRRHAVFSVYHEQIDAFDAEAVGLLEEMASDVSFALDNFDREQERRDAVEALRASEQHFRAFFERSMVGMATSGIDKRWLDVNAALCGMLGYTRHELLQMTWADVTHPEDLANDIYLFNQALLGAEDDYVLEKRLLTKDGRVVHTLTTVRCLRRDDGSIDYFVSLTQDITEKKQSEELLWRQANFDTLTGLPNRRMFADRLQQEIAKRHQARLPLALLFIDLDRFKEVNDTLGHAKGDALLVEAARRIRACVRVADTVARLGGDEFMIILSELPEARQVDAIAGTLLRRLTDAFHLDADTVYVSASIGITLYPADGDSAEQLIRNADQAMYAAKNLGRNRYSYFTNALQEAAQTRQRLITDLRAALAQQQFELYFQPIVELATGRIVKAEALLRWHHPRLGMTSPLDFISLAEETGLIIDIGNWVFREAVQWTQRWNAGPAPGFQITINTSPVEFHADSYDPRELLAYVEQLGLTGSSITVEITEGMLLHAEQRVIDHLLRFRDAGVQIAVDDFGTGYSSLATLNRFDIDVLKIDQAFVRNLASNPNDMALSEAIIVMAHKLGLQVVAEGVETEQQRALLQAAGCDYGQGYLFARPLPALKFERLLAAQAPGPALR